MIDLHTHSLLSDGVLLPSELVRRAEVNGIKAIAITDHVDHSNMGFVIDGLNRATAVLNKYRNIFVIPGVEITHVPIECIEEIVSIAREKGAQLVVGHGESPVEPVLRGTNEAFIKAGVDILAHPGDITFKDAVSAKENGVFLELTLRNGHSRTNKHVMEKATSAGAGLVINTDSHSPDDILTEEKLFTFISDLAIPGEIITDIKRNAQKIVDKVRSVNK